MEDYLIGLSDESRRLRFWGVSVDISDVATRSVDVDQVDAIWHDWFDESLSKVTGAEAAENLVARLNQLVW